MTTETVSAAARGAPPDGAGIAFVGGSMRAGTTLVQRLLCASAEAIPAIAECQYLNAQLDLYRYWSDPDEFATFMADYFESREAFERYSWNIAASFLALARRRYPGARLLVLKNPELTRHFPTLRRWYPQARFVLVLRDPRDVVASVLEVAARQREKGLETPLTRFGRDMRRLARHVMSYYAPSLNARGWMGAALHLVRYEDVAQGEAEATAALYRFAGVAPPAEGGAGGGLAGESWSAFQRHPQAATFWAPLWTEGPSGASVGRHRQALSPAETAELERHFADLNRVLAYW